MHGVSLRPCAAAPRRNSEWCVDDIVAELAYSLVPPTSLGKAAGVQARRYHPNDLGRVWALNDIPHIGTTADPAAPVALPQPERPDSPDLARIETSFLNGGDFVVVEHDGHLIAMGGIRPITPEQAEVLRVRVHPAMRRRGVGRLLMTELERRARHLGFAELHLDTTTQQPEAVAFYRALGYREIGRETRPEWSWTLVYFTKRLLG